MKKILLLLFFAFSSLFSFENLTAETFEQKTKNKNVILEFYVDS